MPLKQKTLVRVSDEAVKKATGKKWTDWFKILDKEKSGKKSHKEIAQWLYDNYPVSGWWSQMLTVEYEKEKGMRELYQKPGGYEVSISKTINVPLNVLYNYFSEEKHRKKWLNEKIEITLKTSDKSLRAVWEDKKTRISVYFQSKGDNKSMVSINHMKLMNSKEAKNKKIFWTDKLNTLKNLL